MVELNIAKNSCSGRTKRIMLKLSTVVLDGAAKLPVFVGFYAKMPSTIFWTETEPPQQRSDCWPSDTCLLAACCCCCMLKGLAVGNNACQQAHISHCIRRLELALKPQNSKRVLV